MPTLTLSPGGVISGTPTTPGSYAFVVRVTGSDGVSSTMQLSIDIPGGDGYRTGVRPTGAYWGAAGEQIDLLSGNLNYTVPLLNVRSRGGWSVPFQLSYNSQMWRQDGSGTSRLSRDVGYGLGWILQAGAIAPFPASGAVQYYVFRDATGAEHRMDAGAGGLYATHDGIYLEYDSAAQVLRFKDGSWWDMTSVSGSQEEDAGTRYPTAMHDTNGNSITIRYQDGAGGLGPNTSARIQEILDPRKPTWAGDHYTTYLFNYTAGHLTSITGPAGESSNFTIGTQMVASPFGGSGVNTPVLQAVELTAGSYQFEYNGSAEMTKAVTPLGGDLRWSYRPYTYTGTGRSYREVMTRQMTKASGATQSTWNVTPANGETLHGSTTVSDLGANSSKVWTFGTSGVSQGLTTSYEERGASGALVRTDYTWTADNGNVYVGSVVNTLNPGASPVQSKNTQSLDSAGNLTTSAVYEYGNLVTPVRTYNYSYLTDANYTNRWIRNRVMQVTMNGTVLVTNTYDGYAAGTCSPVAGLTDRLGLALHDDTNFGSAFIYRGNVTRSVSVGGIQCMGYETTGVATGSMDGSGRYVTATASSATDYSLPGVLTPGGNANLQTTMTYEHSWAVASLTGPNGASGTTTYDEQGRPQTTKIPDGAETNYTYTTNTQKATLGTGTAARWKLTTLDGFGRVVKVESGNGGSTTAVSQVDTEYAPCACSPLGKVWKVSMPHAPSAGAVWTEYTYDASGRTVTVKAPDGSITRTEYLTVYGGVGGNYVKVTDAAGRWKMQQMNALGQLVRVIEPNPIAGGADWITNYSYDALGHLTGVSMPRANGTQTRTFVYTGNDLTSATNPENGTVTYQYDLAHRVTKRTDAKQQETWYTYDAYGRLTQVRHWAMVSHYQYGVGSWLQLDEQPDQQVDYAYDTNPLNAGYSQNAWGRLAAVTFKQFTYGIPYSYMYSYNAAGRVAAQRMDYDSASDNPVTFEATYSWDNEGRMTGTNYGPAYTMQYDANGRLGGMQENGNPMASATYGVAGEMTGLSYMGHTETRSYNTMLQMTRQTVVSPYPFTTVMDLEYNFTAGANNGRIASSKDYVSGETVNYAYDALNRLASAGATNGSWGQAYGYDGFGNLTDKAVTAGSAPTLSVGFDAATNRQNGVSYDANGNPAGAYLQYDVENRMVGSGTMETYAYDPSGKRVKKVMAQGDWEMYFYGVGGQKLVTHACTAAGSCTDKYNAYFGGKLVKSQGSVVLTDRLGSVRVNATSGERMNYYPYGEERTSTANGREKFGTYTRDNVTQDYADQRYYSVGTGRFGTPDPSSGSDSSDPSSWNKYAYAQSDPVNYHDPTGLFRLAPGAWRVLSNPVFIAASMGFTAEYGAGGMDPVDQAGGGPSRPIPPGETLLNRLKKFKDSNCDKVFGEVIDGYTTSGLTDKASKTLIYDVNSPGVSILTQDNVSGNGDTTKLGQSMPSDQTARTLTDGKRAVILLGANFFSNASTAYQGNVLLHELLHAFTNGWSDPEIFEAFAKKGLTHKIGDAEDISAWLSTDCKKTPAVFNWWE